MSSLNVYLKNSEKSGTDKAASSLNEFSKESA